MQVVSSYLCVNGSVWGCISNPVTHILNILTLFVKIMKLAIYFYLTNVTGDANSYTHKTQQQEST